MLRLPFSYICDDQRAVVGPILELLKNGKCALKVTDKNRLLKTLAE